MAKNLKVSLDFDANTSKAQAEINNLQASLQRIALGKIEGVDPKKMQEASAAAKELSIHLNNAYNAKTGNFDLSKLNNSLKLADTNISSLSSKLLQVGASGEQAFVSLAQSIAAADRPMVSLNSKLKEFGTTLANTARWQISSSVLHGFMGAVQKAYGYAQDLNESLNNIRIVTGQTTDQMANFAEKANKAAKALSMSTTEYTDAALIFYQQGLSDEEVLKRTEVTAKMAHAAGESAEAVSSYMTAIWNNFDDGTKSLEYYGDVVTELGARTAASSEEIATGLEKFVSVGETIGLSYEYATAAVTTIVDKTRQSADTVGTALKTIFARLQGLKLGETLEDGVDLNKYSAALESVGVKVLDMSGNLRSADSIIKDLGDTWETLSKAQQTALAQTVAGTRQYTQLMSLMNNFDSFEQNVDFAKNSEGTLQKQADIYAESWEAARDRVQASMQQIYSDLMDDSFFIGMADTFSSLIDSVDGFIDGIGGVKGILLGISSFFLSSISNKIQPALTNLKHNFLVVFSTAHDQARMLSQEMNATIVNTLNSDLGKGFTDASKTSLQNAMSLNEAKSKLTVIENQLTSTERQRYQQELSILELHQEEAQAIADKITKRKEEIALLASQFDYEKATQDLDNVRGKEENELLARRMAADKGEPIKAGDTSESVTKEILKHSAATDNLRSAREAYVSALYESYTVEMEVTKGNIANSEKQYNITKLMPGVLEEYSSKMDSIAKGKKSFETQINGFREIKAEIDLIIGDSAPALSKALSKAVDSKSPKELHANMEKVKAAMKSAKISAADLEKILRRFGQGKNVGQIIAQYRNLEKEQDLLKEKQEAINRAMQGFNPKHVASKIESISKTAAGLGQVVMGLNSIKSAFVALGNEDLSAGEKLSTVIMSLSMAIPSLVAGFKSLNDIMAASQGYQIALTLSAAQYAMAHDSVVASMSAEAVAKKFKISTDQAELVIMAAKTKAYYSEVLAREEGIAAMTAEQLVEKTGMTIDQAKIVVQKLKTGASVQEALATAGLLPAKGANIVATIAETAAYTALSAAMGPVAAMMILLLSSLAAIVLIGAAVVAIITKISNAYNKDAIAAKNAAQAAQALGEAYETARQKYETMIKTMSEYKSAQESLDALTRGTAEYTAKLNEANEKALQLIELLGLVKGAGYTIEDGQIIINEDSEDYKKKAGAVHGDMIKTKNAQLAGEAQAKIAEGKKAQTELVRKDDAQHLKAGAGAGAAAGLATGAAMGAKSGAVVGGALGSIIPGGTAIGAAAGGIIGGVAGGVIGTGVGTLAGLAGAGIRNGIENKADNKKIDELVEQYKKNGEAAFASTDLFKNASDDYIKSVKDVVRTQAQGAEALEAAAELSASAVLDLNEAVQSSKYKDDIVGAGTEAYQKKYNTQYEAYLKKLENWNGIGDANNKEVWEAYKKEALEDLENVKVKNYKSDGSIEYSYETTDASGKTVTETKTATAEEIAGRLAAKDASAHVETISDTLIDVVTKLNESTDKGVKAVASAVTSGDFSKANYEDLKTFQNENGTFNKEKFAEQITNNLTEEQIKELGYDNATAYAEAFETKFNEATEQWKGLEQFSTVSLAEAEELKKISEETGSKQKDVLEYYNSLPEEDKKLFFEIDFDKNKSKDNWKEAIEELKEEKLEVEINARTSEDAEKYDLDADQVKDVAKAFSEDESFYKTTEDSIQKSDNGKHKDAKLNIEDKAEIAADAATRYVRLQEAVIDLSENYEEYEGVLKDIEDASTDVDKAMLANSESGKKLKSSLAKLLGTTEDLIDADLLKAIDPEDFKKAAKGDEAAIERIRDAFIDLQADAMVEADIKVDGFDSAKEAAEAFKTELASLEDGAIIDIDNSPFLQALIQSKLEAGASAADIENLLSGFNIDADVSEFTGTMEEMKAKAAEAGTSVVEDLSFKEETEVNATTVDTEAEQVAFDEEYTATPKEYENQVLEDGNSEAKTVKSRVWDLAKNVKTEPVTGKNKEVVTTKNTTVSNGKGKSGGDSGGKKGGVVIKNATKSAGSSVGKSTKSAASKNLGKGGGGGSSKPTKDARKKKSEMVERYKEVNDKLDEVRDKTDDASKAADRLWGAARIKKMREANKEIENEIKLLQRKGREIKANLKSDLEALQKAARKAKVPEFIVDENGVLTNYEEIMTELYNRREALLDSFGAEIDEKEQKLLEDFDKVYDNVKNAADQYDETREEDRENENAEQEARERIQDNNADILSYELELKITINDNEMKKLEYYLSKTEDDFYQMAEAAEIMLGSMNPDNLGEGGQLGVYLQNLKDLEDQAAKLETALANGDISPEAYHEGMQEIYDSIYENLGSIEELDKAMKNYYGDTLAAAGEEIGKYTERMEHLTSVLSQYKTILEFTGKSTNYKALGEVLKGQAKTTKNSMEAAKKEYEMYESEVAKKKALLDEAIEKNDKEKIELYQKEYDAAIAASNEAQERYLASAEEYAESLKAILENSLNEYAQDLENALTGGTSFDQITTKMERAASLQEEYLTTTNKIYETNKLMNQAQQEIDKSTNSVAQKRLKQFINETDQLQKKNKLSQYELDIQQAKYDLLLAEIALEEAQESKSTVRLQRDSEGNFGYVYTADQSKVDEAAQNLADAQNALYNIALEGANGYTEKYQQTLNEMYSTLTELQQQYLDGAFESEAEYQAAVEEAKSYYYKKLEQYSSLHAIAISTDARVVEDAWSTEFSTMVYETESWKSSVETYVSQVSDAFTEWSNNVNELRSGILGDDLEGIKDEVEKVTTASDGLLDTLTKKDGILDATQEEINKVSELTTKYINQNKELEKQINYYLGLADAIQKKKEAEADPDKDSDKPKDPKNPTNPKDDGTKEKDEKAKALASSAAEIITGVNNGTIPVTENGWPPSARAKGYSEEAISLALQAINDSVEGNGYNYCYEKALELVGLETGGYTGAWGSYGKLAMLHEKELVLNQHDTENFLMSMEILDNIIKTIDLQAANLQIGGLLNSPSFGNFGSQDTLEQNVTIEANFPNVSSRAEIEEAFTTLVNRASQYANRK